MVPGSDQSIFSCKAVIIHNSSNARCLLRQWLRDRGPDRERSPRLACVAWAGLGGVGKFKRIWPQAAVSEKGIPGVSPSRTEKKRKKEKRPRS
jgi:hypothetical protein